MTKNIFRKVFPNPENIETHLGLDLKTKIKSVTITSDEVIIETEAKLSTPERESLEEFLKYGLNSIWKFVKEAE